MYTDYGDEALNQANGKTALQYGETAGYMPFRESMLKLSKKDGIDNIDLDNLIITTASQQGISFMSQVFIDKGDVVITEKPTYLSAIQSFATFGAVFECVSISPLVFRLNGDIGITHAVGLGGFSRS